MAGSVDIVKLCRIHLRKRKYLVYLKNRSVKQSAGETRRYLLCRFKSGGGIEQGGIRPVLIIQNDVGNRHSPTVICAAITSRMNKAKLPTHVEIDARRYHIVKNSVVLLEQIRTIDKQRLRDLVCHLDEEIMNKVDEAIRISFELHT